MDLPTLSFTVVSTMVEKTPEGSVWTGKLEWTANSDRSIREALQATTELAKCDPTAVAKVADWLQDFLLSKGGSAPSAEVKKEAKKQQLAESALQRARKKVGIVSIPCGFPRTTAWTLPSGASESSRSEGRLKQLKQLERLKHLATGWQSSQSSKSCQSDKIPSDNGSE